MPTPTITPTVATTIATTVAAVAPVRTAAGPQRWARVPEAAQRREVAELTSEQFRLARDADPETRRVLIEEIVHAHLWVADAVARRFRYRGETSRT